MPCDGVGQNDTVDRILSDLTDGLPGWLGVVFVVAIVGAGWFGVRQLFGWAGRRAERRRAIRDQRRWAASFRLRYAQSVDRLAGDDDAFALAASAWLAQSSGQSLDVFAYDDPERMRRGILPKHYGVHDRASLLAKVSTLLAEGHRAHPHGDEDGPIDFVAWDLLRVIELSRAAVGLRAVEERTGRDTARFAARVLQSRYSGWEELAGQLERAYRHSHEKRTAHERRLAGIETGAYRRALAGPDGPWSRVGWGTHVKRGDLALLGEAPRREAQGEPREAWERAVLAELAAE